MINISKLDIQKLIDAIEKKRDAGRNIDYLIMNRKTLDEIAYRSDVFIFYDGLEATVYKFRDINIAICERLNFGDIDFVESVR